MIPHEVELSKLCKSCALISALLSIGFLDAVLRQEAVEEQRMGRVCVVSSVEVFGFGWLHLWPSFWLDLTYILASNRNSTATTKKA